MLFFTRFDWCQAGRNQFHLPFALCAPTQWFIHQTFQQTCYQFNKHLSMCLTATVLNSHCHGTQVWAEDLSWITLYYLLYHPFTSPANSWMLPKCAQAERQSNLGGGKLEGLQPGQGWDAPAARKGHTGAVLDSALQSCGNRDIKSLQPWSGPSKPQGPVAPISTALPKVASGVERLQIIFMGDNKNVLPHNQHKTVATVSFSLKQHVLNEHSADKCCKSCKAMHRIIQHALL